VLPLVLVIPASPFTNNTILINVGGFTIGTQGVSIPVSGYYEVIINIYFAASDLSSWQSTNEPFLVLIIEPRTSPME
jgi:hypothetical protein